MSLPFVGEGSVSITPSDTKDLDYPGCVLYADVAGNIHITGMNGMEDTISVAAGAPYPVRVKKLWATGTTATGIHGIPA